MLLPGLLQSPVNIVGGGRKQISPEPGSARQLISRGCGKCQSFLSPCVVGFKTLQVWTTWSICLLGWGLVVRVEMRCESWIPTWELPSFYSWVPSKVPQCFTGAVRATQKQWKQGTIGITGTARLHASLTSQNTFPYPHFPMGTQRHGEISASSTSSRRLRNNNNKIF